MSEWNVTFYSEPDFILYRSTIFFKALSIAALYCRQSEFYFSHLVSGLPPPFAHLELVLRSSIARSKHSTS